MKLHFKELLVDLEVLNAINLAKHIACLPSGYAEYNIDIITATAIRLINDFVVHLEYEIVGVEEPNEFIEPQLKFEINEYI